VARFRLALAARADLLRILVASEARWGRDARRRYETALAATMRQAAFSPEAPLTRNRSELLPGLGSLHLRHGQHSDPRARVKRPVHVVFFRPVEPGLIEIVRVLHERMEPSRHLGDPSES
jgi:toxin ParE1/3/4